MPTHSKQGSNPHGIFTVSVKEKMWSKSLGIGLGLFLVLNVYTAVYESGLSSVSILRAGGATASLLIVMSFAFSTVSYYINFADKWIAYKKYFGLVGYWWAVVYVLALPIVNPERYWFVNWQNYRGDYGFMADVMLGIAAMLILTVMMLISNNHGMKLLGAETWRKWLRLGYVALLLLVVRAVVLDYALWLEWVHDPLSGLPPGRILLSITVLGIIVLRLCMHLSLSHKK